MTIVHGLLHALIDAIGESDTEIGGLFTTRLSTIVMVGDTIFDVESTLGWADSGTLSLEGWTYSYTSKTITTFAGITHVANGVTFAGAARSHRALSTVIDLSQVRTGLDLARRAMLVDYAEGDNLSTLGRNLNVLRSAFMTSDDRYRKIIKALAYNPRGTMHGIELALDGIVDPGNYEIFEDLVNFPCTVFIRLSGAATTETISAGKAFIAGGVNYPIVDPTTIELAVAPLGIEAVQWADEDSEISCLNSLRPSDTLITEYVGQTPTKVWTFSGVNETLGVIPTTGLARFLRASSAVVTYARMTRIRPESNADLSVMLYIPTGGTILDAVSVQQVMIDIFDTERRLSLGFLSSGVAAFSVGFSNGSTLLSGIKVLQRNTWYTIGLHKRGSRVSWSVNGTPQAETTTSVFPATFTHRTEWGLGPGGLSTGEIRVLKAWLHVTTPTSYWASQGYNGTASGIAPTEFDTTLILPFVPGDIGNSFLITGSQATNPQGGNNNGRFIVDGTPGAQTVALGCGVRENDGAVNNANPTRFISATEGAFTFPDDLGKTLSVEGVGPNAGDYTITDLLEPDTLVSLTTGYLTQNRLKTNVAVLGSANFTTETGIEWCLLPVFVAEPGLDWELADTGLISGTTLTLRQALPLAAIPGAFEPIVTVHTTDVLSAQVLLNELIANVLELEGPPPQYSYYPFYLYDPLGFIRPYLDEITAAGVIPELLIV